MKVLRWRVLTYLLALLCVSPAPLFAWKLQKVDSTPLADGLTVISLSFSDQAAQIQWKSALLQGPPRILLRLKNCQTANIPQSYFIDDGTIGRIRLGYHPELRPPELYVVIRAATPATRFGRVVPSGKNLLVYLYREPTARSTPIPPKLEPTHPPLPIPTPPPTPTAIPTPVPPPTPTVLPTCTPLPTPQPTPTPTELPKPRPTPAPVSTPTPIPTLIPEPPTLPSPPEPKVQHTPVQQAKPKPTSRSQTGTLEPGSGPNGGSDTGASFLTRLPGSPALTPGTKNHVGPKIVDFAISQRPEGQTIVRISTDTNVEVGTFGLQYKLEPSPTEILSILTASIPSVQPSVGEADPNLAGIRIQPRQGPAGPSLDIVFGLKAPDIRVLQTAQQERNLVLVFGR